MCLLTRTVMCPSCAGVFSRHLSNKGLRSVWCFVIVETRDESSYGTNIRAMANAGRMAP